MKKSDFYFELPEELIAQTPLEKRDSSRLMCLDRATGEVTHRVFSDLAELLQPGDCLVMNDSRVLPARLMGTRETGGAVEVLLLRDLGGRALGVPDPTGAQDQTRHAPHIRRRRAHGRGHLRGRRGQPHNRVPL